MLINLTKKDIDRIIGETDNVTDALLGLYKHSIEDWDNVETTGHFPKVNETTLQYIFKAINEKQYKGFGMLWVNNGFGVTKEAPDWTVEIKPELIKRRN